MTTKDKKIIEDAEREGIPIFVLTAKDKLALGTLGYYYEQCQSNGCTDEHTDNVLGRFIEWAKWVNDNKDKRKLPD